MAGEHGTTTCNYITYTKPSAESQKDLQIVKKLVANPIQAYR